MTKRQQQRRLLENLIRIAHAESELPPNRSLAAVRAQLELDLGGSVSQRLAAEVLGVSQPGLRRWIESGDIPLVIRKDGNTGVPVSEIIGLALELSAIRVKEGSARFPLDAVMADRALSAESIGDHVHAFAVAIKTDPDPYESVFSRLYNAVLASRINRQMIRKAKQQLWKLQAAGQIDDVHASRWEWLLNQPPADVAAAMTARSATGADLRQNSPFDGLLSHHERRVVFEEATS